MNIQIIKESTIVFFQSLGIEYSSIVVAEEDERTWVTVIPSDSASRCIGYRGQNLTAMQQLFTQLLWEKGLERDVFIVLDIDGYKKKNEEKIVEIVEKKIALCSESGLPQTMPFLGPQERRMVHLYIVQNHSEYETESFTDTKGTRVLRLSKKTVQDELL